MLFLGLSIENLSRSSGHVVSVEWCDHVMVVDILRMFGERRIEGDCAITVHLNGSGVHSYIANHIADQI